MVFRSKKLTIYFLLTIPILLGVILTPFLFSKAVKADSLSTSVTVSVSGCGNEVIETGEQCDRGNLAGQTCQTRGYAGGSLACRPDCTFDISNCTSGDGGGGGGGGGGGTAPQPTVNFSGKAYPKSTVTLLKDAQVVATTVAGTDANFQISVAGLSGGNYMFSVYSEDYQGRRSSLLTFAIGVVAGASTDVSGIFIAPTIAVDKSEVKRGENIAIFGQSAAQADIIITVNSDEELFRETISDKNGIYLYNINTALLDIGQHFAKSKATAEGTISSFSKTISFMVGVKTALAPPPGGTPLKADLNNDHRVNLVDFSIFAYWYKRALSAEVAQKEKELLNGDGKIDLADFSIMAYFWTG